MAAIVCKLPARVEAGNEAAWWCGWLEGGNIGPLDLYGWRELASNLAHI